MSLVLKAGARTRLKFETLVGGERLLVDLFFNNEFRGDSWTRPMRPDASLVVRRPHGDEVWLHFDAKYRVDWSSPFQTGGIDDEEAAERTGASKRTDLLKMHAYRDAIRNSAGSYVLFPGSESAEYAVNTQEFLPGLGAFPLRPDEADADGAVLHAFITRVLVHVAGAATRHRRALYWTGKAYEGAGTTAADAAPPLLDLPPADTNVLIGYVRSDEQWAWIDRVGLYNVRSGSAPGALAADEAALDSTLLLLYGRERGTSRQALYRRVAGWQAVSAEGLKRLGYRQPRNDAYLVTSLERLPSPDWMQQLSPTALKPFETRHGAPFSRSWLDLVLSTPGD